MSYISSRTNPCVRVKFSDGGAYTLTDTCRDDVWGASSSLEEARARKEELAKIWDIKDVGHTQCVLGMDVDQDLAAGTGNFAAHNILQLAVFTKVERVYIPLVCAPF
jgi:hypothetical protein